MQNRISSFLCHMWITGQDTNHFNYCGSEVLGSASNNGTRFIFKIS